MNMDSKYVPSTDPSDGYMSVLVSNMEDKFRVRDSLLEEVVEGLSDQADVPKRHKALAVVLNSVIVNYRNPLVCDERSHILSKKDLDRLLSPQMLEDKVARPLVSGEYSNELLKESTRLLFAASAYLPLDVYGKVYTVELIATLISIAEYASADVSPNRELWSSSISTIRNVICGVDLNEDLLNRLVNCFFNIVDEAAVELCSVIVGKILLDRSKGSGQVSPRLLKSNLCLAMKITRRITQYLVSVFERTQDTHILSTACSCLISICEHSFGVDLFLESGGLRKVLDLALIAVTKHEAVTALENKMSKKPDISPKLTCISPNLKVNQLFHELGFSALSVISKVAFTANHRQIVALINNEVPETLVRLLNCPVTTAEAKARCCNTLGNLACETDSEVQAIIDADALVALIDTFQSSIDHNVRVESAYAICACLSKSNRKQIGYIISCNSKSNHLGDGTCMILVSNMLDFITTCDPTNESSIKLCRVVLNGLENVLRVGEDETKVYNLTENPYIRMLREAEGDVRLSRVCLFPEYNIARKANRILSEFFEKKKSWNMERVH